MISGRGIDPSSWADPDSGRSIPPNPPCPIERKTGFIDFRPKKLTTIATGDDHLRPPIDRGRSGKSFPSVRKTTYPTNGYPDKITEVVAFDPASPSPQDGQPQDGHNPLPHGQPCTGKTSNAVPAVNGSEGFLRSVSSADAIDVDTKASENVVEAAAEESPEREERANWYNPDAGR